VEEKYGKPKYLQKGEESETDSEEDVDEDDDGELATEALDAEIFATLNAIRSKDPRVYKSDVKFYDEADDEDVGAAPKEKKEKPMTLKDYHTKNLLEGRFAEDDEDEHPKTYAQEQEDMRQDLVKQMHAAGETDEDEEDNFLVTKSKPEPIKERTKITEQDVVNADKDPETFLSNFMASRAWVPTDKSNWKPLESDDEDEEARAEEYEDAYNRYFEETAGANEKLVTYARDAVASTTVRRDAKSGRRKAREAARAKREAERRQREEDLARMRKLNIEEMEEKVHKIRKAAGLKGREFQMDDWADILEGEWSDDEWDREMRKRFGDAYYDDEDAEGGALDSDDDGTALKKPEFDTEIDMGDISGYEDEADDKPAFTLSSDEEEEDEEEEEARPSGKSAKQRKQERADAKSSARRDRRLIEKLVDSNLEYEAALAANPKAPTRFRYRETSPTDFGLTPRDILLADDAQLNEFAGLKKLAAFRDPVKKKKDKKHLSKKARLRQWRTATFGDADGPKGGFETLLGEEAGAGEAGRGKSSASANDGVDIREDDGKGKSKKKRNRKRKAGAVEA
jgi:protein KRI1